MNKKNLMAEMIDAVKAIYQSAWSKAPEEEKVIHVVIDAAVSLLAPVAIVWAAIDTYISFSGRFPDFFYVMLVVPPSILFVLACYVLKKHAKEHAPLLAFAVLLFSSGAVFTSNELIEHTNTDTIPAFKKIIQAPAVPAVPATPTTPATPATPATPGGSSNPPWGDFLLAFSALCVMIEEFSLFGIYDAISRRVKETEKLRNQATQSHAELVGLTVSAEKEYKKLTALHEKSKTLYDNMSQQSREWNESRQAVLLKACGVVGIIVLVFTSMCG